MNLAGVSCAGLRDVTVVDGFTAGHTSQLVLSHTRDRRKRENRREDNQERERARSESWCVMIDKQNREEDEDTLLLKAGKAPPCG